MLFLWNIKKYIRMHALKAYLVYIYEVAKTNNLL